MSKLPDELRREVEWLLAELAQAGGDPEQLRRLGKQVATGGSVRLLPRRLMMVVDNAEILRDPSLSEATRQRIGCVLAAVLEFSRLFSGPLLSPAEAAAELRVTPKHVRHLLATGRLHGDRVGNQWYTTREAVAVYRTQCDENPRTGRSGRPRVRGWNDGE